jgi:hypothetical protein
MAAVNPVPGGQVGGSALAGLAATPTAASAATDRSAPMRRLMKHTICLVVPFGRLLDDPKATDARAAPNPG